ncbi:MAG: DUF1905 domain-containing protein [Alphaproteobacteria bacterium]|nr:DUF1905 domain-containing protein [Alphaproteobacteria bacterium]MCB9796103.1 DUF1905 domain-containing protein [Alphaproteobacteria bacterium]
MKQTFEAELLRGDGQDTLGFVVPDAVVEAFNAGRRPPVRVTLRGYTYASTVARMGGRYLVGVAKEHRGPAGITDEVSLEVTLELDAAPRQVAVPEDLAAALAQAGAREGFERLAPSRRKELVRQVEAAKKADTRARRIGQAVAAAAERA